MTEDWAQTLDEDQEEGLEGNDGEQASWESTKPQDSAAPSRSRNETYRRRLMRDNADILELIDRKKSQRALKRLLRPSPTLHLEQALAEANDPRILPRQKPQSVHDLSYRDAKTLKVFNVNGFRAPTLDDSVSLQSITAKFIRQSLRLRDTSASTERVNFSPFYMPESKQNPALTPHESQILQKHGCDENGPRTWASILLQPNTIIAARSLKIADAQAPRLLGKTSTTPWFVMNFLLRRGSVDAEALRLILEHAWNLLTVQEMARFMDKTATLQPPCPNMMTVLCIRLVRHARDVWPQALPNITKLFATYALDARAQHHTRIGKPIGSSLLKDLTFKSNRMLGQLSLHGKTYPVLSGVHQQRAQFDLIRKMMRFQPALSINREGHRALTKTLLLQKRTIQERDWASLQARSWPPFKISRNRLDDPKDRQYGTSTAGKAIDFMRAYGYHMRVWDLIAQVYTGWNPDGSPSVQRRAMTMSVPTSFRGEPEVDELHAAMIGSTRTIPEAWAAFLKFDLADGLLRATHMAMFKKLLIHEKPLGRPPRLTVEEDRRRSFAGDGIEVLPPPTSPMESIYLPSEPPSIDSFYDSLFGRGIPIRDPTMSLLLEKAPSLAFGLKVWNDGQILKFDNESKPTWSTEHLTLLKAPERERIDIMPDIPVQLLTALVACLCNFTHSVSHFALLNSANLRVGSWWLDADHSLVYAYRLLSVYKVSSARAWNYVLNALCRRSSLQYALLSQSKTRERFWPLIAWAMAKDVIQGLIAVGTPDHKTFQHLCDITMEAGVVVRLHGLDNEETRFVGTEDQTDLEKEVLEASIFLSQGSGLLRWHFARLVGLHQDGSASKLSARANIPQVSVMPTAAVLHKYVRALGILGDHEGIYSLVRWMVQAANELQELQDTQLNGSLHMRRLVVSLRVWLECPSRDFVLADRAVVLEPAGEDLVQLVRQAVAEIKHWGGWPTDAEVDKYCRR